MADAFTRCKEAGGKIKVMIIDPRTKKRGRVCKLPKWGPVAESVPLPKKVIKSKKKK